MDIILLIILSNVLAGKFRKAGKTGVAKYIFGMIGVVLASELIGLLIVNATGSLAGLIVCMLIGVAAVIVIFMAGAKKAAAEGEGQTAQPEQLTPLPSEIRLSAIICAVGAFLTGTFGWMLTLVMSYNGQGFARVMAGILRGSRPGVLFFILMGIGALVLSVGCFIMAALKKPCGNVKATSLLCGITTLVYSAYLFYGAASYVDVFVKMRSTSMLIPFYIPLIIDIIVTIAFLIHLTSLYGRTGKAGRVLAAIAMVVMGVVFILDIYTLIILKAPSSMRTSLYFSWYGSSILGYWLFAVLMLCAAFGKKSMEDLGGH